MKVDLTNSTSDAPETNKSNRAVQGGVPGGAVAGAAVTTAAQTGNLPVDQTSFSFDQVRVQALAAQVLAQPEVRDAKVQALQQAISQGHYLVSSGQIADALAQDLAGVHA
jgi:flagellar biosynthesis anti-sigma factor FlgM